MEIVSRNHEQNLFVYVDKSKIVNDQVYGILERTLNRNRMNRKCLDVEGFFISCPFCIHSRYSEEDNLIQQIITGTITKMEKNRINICLNYTNRLNFLKSPSRHLKIILLRAHLIK